MHYLAVSLRLFKYFKSKMSPLKILIRTASDATEKDSDSLHFQKILESIVTKIVRGIFHKSDTVMPLNFPGLLL